MLTMTTPSPHMRTAGHAIVSDFSLTVDPPEGQQTGFGAAEYMSK